MTEPKPADPPPTDPEPAKPKHTDGAKTVRRARLLTVVNMILLSFTAVLLVTLNVQVARGNRDTDDIHDFVDTIIEERAQPTDPQLQAVFDAVFTTLRRANELVALMCLEHPDAEVCVGG